MGKIKWKRSLHALLSASLIASLIVPAIPAKVWAETKATDLIISEYMEGSSFNKAIEIYNGTGAAVDLSAYTLELHVNGAIAAGQKLPLSGNLEAGDTFVVHHKDANAAIKAQGDLVNSTVINFNGDDPVVLRKAGQVVDSIGQAAGSSIKFGENVTLVRKSNITSGDTIINDEFNRDLEWLVYPIDTTEHLGKHTMDSGADPGEPELPTIITIADAREKALGETVTVKGVVAAKLKNTISVQDETGGIAVRPTSLALSVGDEVTLTGKLADYQGLLQLDGSTVVAKGAHVGEPSPKVVTGAEVNEDNESQLVTVKNVTLTKENVGSGWVNYTADDGSQFIVRDETGQYSTLKVGTTFESISGIVQQFGTDYQLIPRSETDIVVDSSILQPAIATPGSGTFVGGTTVTLTTSTAGASIFYTVDGTNPTTDSTKYEAPILIEQTTTLKAIVVKDGTASDVSTFDYTITDALQIHDIQGDGHTSPFNDQTVEGIEGIVTYTFTLNNSNYYTIQTPDALADNNPNTSEAILLYSGNKAWPVKVGDLVSVTGKVSEYAYDGYSDRNTTDLKTTQINVRDDQGGKVTVKQSGVELPKPILIDESNMSLTKIDSDNLTIFNPETDAIDFWESIEGMRVQVGNVKAVAPQEHGDLITVLESAPTNTLHGGVLYEEDNQNANRIQFRLEPNGPARDFEVATGDKFEGPITGIVGYSYQNFKIYVPLDEMKVKHRKGQVKPETTKIVKADDKLTVASYNLENFSNNKTETTDDKAKKLARAIGSDMGSPDIVGVTEVQDNNGSQAGDSKADQSYARLIAEIKKAGGVEYKYVNIDPENNMDGGAPNANIRVGFLYNPERVSLTEGIPAGNATTAVDYEDGKLTLNPGRIDPTNAAFESSRKPLAAQFNFQGESVIVIANHWNSKSGDTPLFGATQPPVYKSEAQRNEIAKVVYGFVQNIKSKNADANIISLGDFNDYQFAAPLKIHEGNLMKNMIHEVEASDRYTYLYQGNSQVLDHILVSNNLASKTVVDILHINADFTDMAGRASDHDPVMIQIDMKKNVEPPIIAEKVYEIKNTKTKKLTFTKPSIRVDLDASSIISEGIVIKSHYAELHGEGFKLTDVTIKPDNADAIIDLKGTAIKKLVIDGTHVSEVRGAENIESIEFINGADPSNIKFTNSKGDPIADPSSPKNNPPSNIKPFPNRTATVGEELSFILTDYFWDEDGDELTFSATKGEINGNQLTLTLPEGSHIVGVTASDGKSTRTASFSVTVISESNEDDYYAGSFGKEGAALKAALHDIISTQKQLSYSEVWEALKITDEDPANQNNVILFYSGESRAKNRNGGNIGDWNREHTWAQSHGGFGTSKGPGTDIHHLRPTDTQVNNARGNLDFDNGGNPVAGCNGCYKDGDSFEPPDRVKGDVARILFYMATRYEKGDVVDLELNDKTGNGSVPYHGKLSVLLQWHKQDPVDAYEKQRNEKIYTIQGNRNPFIDHPEWVEKIWN